LGKITKWNDPAIVENNKELNLPDAEIVPARRSDGSGTTFVFTDYLSTISSEFDEKVGKGKSVPWPVGVGAAGNEGVAGIVRSTPYAIGYVELAYAFQTGMSFAFVQNADRTKFIEPTLDAISAASAGVADNLPQAESDWSSVSLVNAPGSDSYPIASFTYLLVYEDISQVTKSKDEAKAVIHLIHWMITEGQEYSPTLLYVPLSDKVVEIGKQGLARVKYGNDILWDYSGIIQHTNGLSETSEYNIPQWIRNNARWWADGMISDSDYINGLQYLISRGILRV
jgi:phosphate ABC transporter phosphate-binding protein